MLGLLVLVSVTSGAYMAYGPLSTAIARLAGSPPAPSPPVGATATSGSFPEALRLSSVIATADAALPGGRVSIVVRPPTDREPIRARKRLPDEIHPNGLSSVWLDPATGSVLRATQWREADAAVRGFEFIYPLHIGQLTPAHWLVVLLAGVALCFHAASGPWLWISRRRTRRANAARVHRCTGDTCADDRRIAERP